MFQLTFAIITAALVVGSFVERMRFSAMLIFMSLWTVIVYAPIAHWVWEPNGWLARMGALDFAGGSVVHINAGIAGLVCAYVLGPRHGYGREPFTPFNLGLTMAGAGMLWVGWFGFQRRLRGGLRRPCGPGDGGHAHRGRGRRAVMDGRRMDGARPAFAAGPVLGPGGRAGRHHAGGRFCLAARGARVWRWPGLACYWGATGLKRLLNADDSLDVFGVHGVGGIVGSLLTGVFASKAISGVGRQTC
jgi:Amt family ammonium transporter